MLQLKNKAEQCRVQPFRVAINAKGGDCWHVFQEKNVLVIDGKNNSDDIQKIDGKNNNIDGILTGRKEAIRKVTMMENRESISSGEEENSKQRSQLRRDSTLHFPEVQPRSKRKTHRRRKGRDL
jgi:hypothetical protein